MEELRKDAEERGRDGVLRGDEEGGDRKWELGLAKTSSLANDAMVVLIQRAVRVAGDCERDRWQQPIMVNGGTVIGNYTFYWLSM